MRRTYDSFAESTLAAPRNFISHKLERECQYRMQVEYLGHIVSEKGCHRIKKFQKFKIFKVINRVVSNLERVFKNFTYIITSLFTYLFILLSFYLNILN